jgi:hypothetical protein
MATFGSLSLSIERHVRAHEQWTKSSGAIDYVTLHGWVFILVIAVVEHLILHKVYNK